MMDCLEFRRRMLEAPRARAADLSAHRLGCPPCAAWAARAFLLEGRLSEALSVDVPEGLKERVMLKTASAPARSVRWRAAAAVLVFVAAGLVAVPMLNRPALADAVVAHLYHEPELLLPSELEVDPVRLHEVLARVGGSLHGDIGKVTHAGLCPINGKLAAHLVVAGRNGPVAVIVMPGHGIQSTQRVADSSFRGAILPVGAGSVAIIGSDAEQLDELFERVRRSFQSEV